MNTLNYTLLFLLAFCSVVFTQEQTLWDPEGDTQKLLNNVERYIDYGDSELRTLLDKRGKQNSNNIDMVFVTYDLALLYHETQNPDYAHKAAILLDEYANVFPDWPVDLGNSRGYSVWWQDWFHRDLGWVARFLPMAYDLIANSGALEENNSSPAKILALFRQIVNTDLQYPLYIFNAAGTRPLGLFIFGRVLDDPELVHLAWWYYNKMLHYLFCYDGFVYEGTYEYGATIYFAITKEEYNFYWDGYSDPPGYDHVPIEKKWDPRRIDNLDFDAVFGNFYQRIEYALWRTALPDYSWPVMNETSVYPNGYSNQKYIPYRQPAEQSLLLGGIGHAILANGEGDTQSQVRLDFSPSISHSHLDALHLIYYNKGKEVIGGTGYTEGDRQWNKSSMNQNLVVVNETEQDWDYWVYQTGAPYIPESGRIQGMPETNEYPDVAMHNNLLHFIKKKPAFDAIQLVEADATPAYQSLNLDRYQRFLAQVKIDDSNEYLVDLFTVKGGAQYDWLLHGGHDNYILDPESDMTPANGQLGDISIQGVVQAPTNWSATLLYDQIKHKIILHDNQNTHIYTGKALRSSKDHGLQDYVIARRGATSQELVTFKAVHESYIDFPQIQNVTKLSVTPPNNHITGIKINLTAGRWDYMLYNSDENDNGPFDFEIMGHHFQMRGKFAHLRFHDNNLVWLCVMNASLSSPSFAGFNYQANEISGRINRVTRIRDGYSRNVFETDSDILLPENLAGKTIITSWGNGWSWGYNIESVDGNKVIVSDDPGFIIKDDGSIDMQAFPVGEFAGPVTFKISNVFAITGENLLQDNTKDTVGPQPPSFKKIEIIE